MAVKDDIYYPTEDLILSKPRRHFRAAVHTAHWQLRSLIGAEKRNIVYFPAGTQTISVHRLNTTTNETELVRRLPFHPRCLVAQNGWVCCGGETGEFTAIRVGEEENTTHVADIDALAGGLRAEEQVRIDSLVLSALSGGPVSSKGLLAKSKTFGKERVNCITLWFPPTLVQPHDGAYHEPIAVLSNNDKTVTTVNLPEQKALDDICYPDCVNRAVLSPDGGLLVAISDDPYLYIHERVKKASRVSNASRSNNGPAYEWNLCRRIHLKSQSLKDRSDSRGSFAVCFSSTGKLLAVATQYGVFSIFEVAALTVPGMDPLIMTFSSPPQPNTDPGAVRDMAFAPGPIDLLAWTEDRSRVGVADLRNGFMYRQIFELDKTDEYEHIAITEQVPEGGERPSIIDPRLLEHRGEQNDNLSRTFASTLDLTVEGRSNLRPEVRETLERYHLPLTSDETLVLEALQEHRRRREQRDLREQRITGGQTSTSRTPWEGMPPRITTTTAAAAATTTGDNNNNSSSNDNSRPRERSISVTRTVSELLGNIREQRERIRDNQERMRVAGGVRGGGPPPPPARLGGPDTTRPLDVNDRRALITRLIGNNSPAASSSLDVEALYYPTTTTTTTTTTATTASATTLVDGGLPSASILMNAIRSPLSLLSNNNNNATTATATSTVNANNNTAVTNQTRRRDRAAYLMRDWEEHPNRRVPGTFLSRDTRSNPHDTAGLSWSEDGQILFIGAKNGIYEFQVNLHGRRVVPSIDPR
ncbi:hypothetical protein B0T17DRAFT_615667 [Bombardia bombarda]|uniref:DUF2415 domain-containing protein n=1 Tax=Bombardia bombarda TaxID=252184 RepID=A0AA40C9F2_9PEZI|nr:hypothetical protein B0T17DRAFT_615667 [Bombardia bombarda]